MRSFAILSLLAALGTATPMESIVERQSTTCTNGNFQAGTQTCLMRCNTDMPGGNQRTVLQTTLQSCAEACAGDALCIVAQRDASNGNCFLKLEVTAFVAKQGIDTVQCQNQCVSGDVQVRSRTCTVTCGADRNGPSYKQSSSINAIDCGSQCAADPACILATFWSGHCYLKSVQYAMTSNANVNAIDCPIEVQAPAPTATVA